MIQAVNVKDFLSPRYWPTWAGLALVRLVSKMPLTVIEWCGSVLGGLLYWLMAERRHVADVNLRFAFPDYTDKEIKRMIKICFRNVGIAVFELGLAWWENERLLEISDIEGLEYLQRAQQKGKGVIILTAHFTCLEIGGPVLNHYVPIQVMYKRAHNPLFDAFMRYHRSRLYKAIVDHNKPISLIRGLKKGYAAWYAPDQDFGSKDTVYVPFFGMDATALTAPARFSEISGAPVVPYYIIRKPSGAGYKLVILPELENFPSKKPLEDAVTINQTIEQLILKNPDQYLWIHKRYKNRPEGAERVYRKK
ncbi:MAG: LpxL/LpxP family Kdo(2)-lipid IV(A) lauroyl/palmitoleoyl acyltransferase [Gammaproteobacteria bacterium]|nr:LpxL/LpxP family Kdo(2)-lipid IV(A) lauroyl/palmitoleoyl acyltransferase [Gammaproteobacteria bacterium]